MHICSIGIQCYEARTQTLKQTLTLVTHRKRLWSEVSVLQRFNVMCYISLKINLFVFSLSQRLINKLWFMYNSVDVSLPLNWCVLSFLYSLLCYVMPWLYCVIFCLHLVVVNADDWFLFVLVALIHGIRWLGGNVAGFSCMLVPLIAVKHIKLWSNFSRVLLVNCFSIFWNGNG